MPHRVIRTDEDQERYFDTLRSLKKPYTGQHKQGVDRSLDQNALQWAWAGEFARQMGDRTADEVQADWKLRHGIPMLRSEDELFRQSYDETIKPLPYERKIVAMKYMSVSSIMTVKQMTQYLETIQREAAEQGVILKSPEQLRPWHE